MRNITFFVLILGGLLSGCSQDPTKGFETTDSGLQYKFHEQTENPKAELGEVLKLEMIYLLNNDSVIFNSIEMNNPVFLELIEPQYPGDIYEGFAMMAEGDSITFVINAEQFFLETAQMPSLPAFADSTDNIFFNVKLLAAMNEEEFMEEQMRASQEMMQENQIRAEQEDSLMIEYLDEQEIDSEARESGLVYVETQAGSGQRVQAGDTVRVHYEGRLMDGTVFDSSLERDEPIEFVVGVGQVIPGWDEGITLMNEGGKAQLIIPSYLGYGESGAGEVIPPFSTLIFDVEVVEVK